MLNKDDEDFLLLSYLTTFSGFQYFDEWFLVLKLNITDDEDFLMFAYQVTFSTYFYFWRFRKGVQIFWIFMFPSQVC